MRNEELIVAHMKFACQLAAKKQRSLALHVELSDLESEAVFGLMKAGARFTAKMHVPFTAFVRVRIQGQMEDWCSYRNQTPFMPLLDNRAVSRKPKDLRALEIALATLPARERHIVLRRHLHGVSTYGLIAETGLSQARVAQLEYRGLKKLRAALERRGVHKVSDIL